MEFEFTLKFMLAASAPDADALVELLGAVGCNDALIGIGQAGRIALDFTRDAESAKQAIFIALAEIKCAIPSAKFLEVTADRSYKPPTTNTAPRELTMQWDSR